MSDNNLAAPLPCPFCGGQANIADNTGPKLCTTAHAYVFCLTFGCPGRSDEQETVADAIAAWNTRAADQRCAELEAENARLREALAELELCNENLAAQRSVRTYLSIIEDGSESLLLALDTARLKARQTLENRNG